MLVRPLKDSEKVGSILLPEKARDPERALHRGVVVACGPGDKRTDVELKQIFTGPPFPPCASAGEWWPRHPMHVKPGDTIIYPRVPANVVNLGGEELVLLHEEQQILAVLEQE